VFSAASDREQVAVRHAETGGAVQLLSATDCERVQSVLSAPSAGTGAEGGGVKPLAIDLYCGLGGWTEGLLAEGYRVVGFDIERHVYGEARYPAQLVLQDILTIHGRQLASADLIVASPPCQAYSYRAMPWKRAKALPPPDNSLFEACFRIQREAMEASGRFIPLVVENVRGAQPYVGRARCHSGAFYFWGDVPALMPPMKPSKQPGHWFKDSGTASGSARFGSKSKERKEWSAHIAKIPYELARWVGRAWKVAA
jgi:hypothetical protein